MINITTKHTVHPMLHKALCITTHMLYRVEIYLNENNLKLNKKFLCSLLSCNKSLNNLDAIYLEEVSGGY